MTGEEARLILGVTEKTSWEDIVKVSLSICVSLLICLLWHVNVLKTYIYVVQKFETMFEKNTKSFYLQSKIHRAKEFLETLQWDTGHPLWELRFSAILQQ